MARSEVTTRQKAYSRDTPNQRTRACGCPTCSGNPVKGKIGLLQPVVIEWDGRDDITFYHASHVKITRRK